MEQDLLPQIMALANNTFFCSIGYRAWGKMHSVKRLASIFEGNESLDCTKRNSPTSVNSFVSFSKWFLLCSWLMVTFQLQVTTVARRKLEKVQIVHNHSIQSHLTHWQQLLITLCPILRTFDDRQRLLDYWSSRRKLLASIMLTN